VKIYRKLITQPALAPLAPLLTRMDDTLRCLLHYRSSRVGLRTLRESPNPQSKKILDAVRSAAKNPAVEGQRAKLLARTALLDPEGPFDKGITISAACAISKSPRQAALLAAMVRSFEPTSAIELGTNVGISSAYIASSMKDTLVTLEASSARQSLAKQVHDNLGLTNVEYVLGLFEDTLDRTLEKLPPLDFAFIDGHHEYRPTIDYFDRIAKRSNPGAVFVFDDINWSEGMKKAWSEVRTDARFSLVVDFGTVGVGVLRSDDTGRTSTVPITCY
jgi:predicted O-methyltransferase YrrM